MKINVSISSRGAPSHLETTVRLLKNLESGEHEVKYIIGLDNDDMLSCVRLRQEFQNDKSVLLSIGERPITIGSVWNRCIKLYDADVYVPLGDDSMCLTQYWDIGVVELSKSFFIISSFCAYSHNSVVFPILRKDWMKAAGYLFPEHFPYWFNDTWLHELYEFATGENLMVSRDLVFGGAPGKTRGMRDLDFWWGFFNATRKQRIMEAIKIRYRLKLSDPKPHIMKSFIEKWEDRDAVMRDRIPELSQNLTIESSVSPQYRIAKKNAEDYLQQHGLTLWSNADGKV